MLLLEKKWAKNDLQLDVDFDEYLVVANEDMLKQVWFNLIDNAIKFSNRGGLLKINIVREDKTLAVTIANEGEEIASEEYEKIFQKFYQTKTSSQKKGNGIGLSIVKHIVDLHNGKISVESQNGTTAFTVKLPII